nr:hypothetical protein [Tanacetum cinerariifolium]
YPVVHQPPQETNTELLQARENLMEPIQVFLKKQEEKSIEELLVEEQAARINSSLQDHNPPQFFISLDGDDDDRDYDKERNEELNTIPEKELDEFIKSSVEDLVPIPTESEDTFESESICILPSDDESLSDEDVPEDNVKIYSNPLFEFDDEYISSNVNPLFDEVLEDIGCKDCYDPYLDESTFLVTPLFDSNEDEYFTPGENVELLLHHDPSIPKMSVTSILEGFTDEPPLEENDDLFDLDSKNDDWKKILYNA